MRLSTETIGSGDTSWLGSDHGIFNGRTSTFVVANFTAGTHYPNGYVPSGLAVNCADEANLKPWTAAAGEVLGFVLFDRAVGSGDAKFAVPVLRHGIVRRKRLPIVIAAPAAGTAEQFTFIEGSDL